MVATPLQGRRDCRQPLSICCCSGGSSTLARMTDAQLTAAGGSCGGLGLPLFPVEPPGGLLPLPTLPGCLPLLLAVPGCLPLLPGSLPVLLAAPLGSPRSPWACGVSLPVAATFSIATTFPVAPVPVAFAVLPRFRAESAGEPWLLSDDAEVAAVAAPAAPFLSRCCVVVPAAGPPIAPTVPLVLVAV